jgi:tetratricopeptide (TPR) repeat protein
MLKYIVSAVLCLGCGVSCAAQDIPREVKLPFNMTASSAIVYAAAGNMHLLLKDFETALEDFRKASFCIEQCSQERADIAEFLSLFGQVIAYDNLNRREECEQVLGALILSTNDEEEEEDEEDDDFEFSLKEKDKLVQKLIEMTVQVFLITEAHTMLLDLAHMAPSEDVREALITIINKDWDEI